MNFRINLFAVTALAACLNAQGASAACLETNNDRFTMAQGDVYSNGEFSWRFDFWEGGPTVVMLTITSSNVPNYSGKWFARDGNFYRTDGWICDGEETEVTVNCDLSGDEWSCKISELKEPKY